ncbi:MAG: hypothetical protein AB8E87_03125 [Prochlorococcus sp.]
MVEQLLRTVLVTASIGLSRRISTKRAAPAHHPFQFEEYPRSMPSKIKLNAWLMDFHQRANLSELDAIHLVLPCTSAVGWPAQNLLQVFTTAAHQVMVIDTPILIETCRG